VESRRLKGFILFMNLKAMPSVGRRMNPGLKEKGRFLMSLELPGFSEPIQSINWQS
jgi:hypothetical protein